MVAQIAGIDAAVIVVEVDFDQSARIGALNGGELCAVVLIGLGRSGRAERHAAVPAAVVAAGCLVVEIDRDAVSDRRGNRGVVQQQHKAVCGAVVALIAVGGFVARDVVFAGSVFFDDHGVPVIVGHAAQLFADGTAPDKRRGRLGVLVNLITPRLKGGGADGYI